MGIKSPIHIKILNDTLDIVTLMTHAYTAEPTLLCNFLLIPLGRYDKSLYFCSRLHSGTDPIV